MSLVILREYVAVLSKENIPPEILVSFAYLGCIVYASLYSREEKRFSTNFKLNTGENLLCTLFVQIAGYRAPKLYRIQLKLRKYSPCISETYFLLRTFSARFHLSRKFIFTRSLLKYDSGIISLFYYIERVK